METLRSGKQNTQLQRQVLIPPPLTGDAIHLEKAVAFLNSAVARSKYKYQLRVLLIRIFRLLG
jgi:hypothetical protein